MMRSLEIRDIEANEYILEELDEVQEIVFVQQGRYNIGYEINKQEKFRLQFGARTIIGGFNLNFDKRSFFIYRAHTAIKAMSIRKSNWK